MRKNKKIFFLFLVDFIKKNISLPPHWFRICLSIYLIKRESGENPEQTRYCESYCNVLTNTIATA